jgi:serine/threonine protein kinase
MMAAPPPTGPDLPPGSVIGKYRLHSVLGRGGMGVVYEAENSLIGRRVALKMLSPAAAGDTVARQRLLAEAAAAARLEHPNVVTVYDAEHHGEHCYIVLQLVRGGTAHELLRDGRLGWRRATRIVADACRGLAAAHAAGFIHRDIKPANIMLAEDDSAKLGDFGLAKCAVAAAAGGEGLTLPGMVLGTPHYMSPEQFENGATDVRSDVYSLGGTYYALLTGRPPYFDSASLQQLMFRHVTAPPPDPREFHADIPDGCAEVVIRAMAKSPNQRYARAADMLADLESLLADRSPAVPVRPAASGPGAGPSTGIPASAPLILAEPEPAAPPRRLAELPAAATEVPLGPGLLGRLGSLFSTMGGWVALMWLTLFAGLLMLIFRR